MKDLTIIVLLVIIVILTGVIDATLTLNEQKQVDCLFEQARSQSQENWKLEDLFNDGEWCFLDQDQPLPVDCQFNNTFLGEDIE
jgi:hypothetical protein